MTTETTRDTYNIAERSASIRDSIEIYYLAAVANLTQYKMVSRRKIGNSNLFFLEFLNAFEALVTLTEVDQGIAKYTMPDDTLLLDNVNKWLENGMTKQKVGIELFLKYRKALFDKSILRL